MKWLLLALTLAAGAVQAASCPAAGEIINQYGNCVHKAVDTIPPLGNWLIVAIFTNTEPAETMETWPVPSQTQQQCEALLDYYFQYYLYEKMQKKIKAMPLGPYCVSVVAH